MKALLLLLLLFAQQVYAQVTPLDINYRKVFITGEAGASSFTRSPLIGLVGELIVTDSKFPVIINFRNGLWITPGAVPSSVFIMQLDAGKRYSTFKHTNDITFHFGFMKYYPRTDFIVPIGASFVKRMDNLSFRMDANWCFSYVKPGIGINAVISYKLFQLKKI